MPRSWRRSRRSSASPESESRARDFKTAIIVDSVSLMVVASLITWLMVFEGHFLVGGLAMVFLIINSRATESEVEILTEDMEAWVKELEQAIEENVCPNNSSP